MNQPRTSRLVGTRAQPLFVAAILIALLCMAPELRGEVDRFYSGLLERGTRDLASGRIEDAEKQLRIASFGLLDQPALLAECLIRLGQAQAAAGNLSDLSVTVGRLVEIEAEFGAYTALGETREKAAFEEILRSGPPGLDERRLLLGPTPGSAPIPQKEAPVSGRAQRKALEERVSADPADREAFWELARLDLSDGKPKRAAARLDRLLEAQPGDVPALCLRAEIGVPRGECAPALAAAGACPTLLGQDDTAAFVLECLTSAGRHAEAAELLDGLPTERRQAPAMARAAARIQTPLEEPALAAEALAEVTSPVDPAAESAPPSGQGSESIPPVTDPAIAPTSPTELPSEPRVLIGIPLDEQLRRLRTTLASARVRSDLIEPMARAGRLADQHPDSAAAQHLAAEIAFRSADYPQAVEYFSRGGQPDPEQHVLLFFLAVSLFETGEIEEARRVLLEALPGLEASEPSAYVRASIERILGSPPASDAFP